MAEHSPDSGLPEPDADPLESDRQALRRTIEELATETELAARAELAGELVGLSTTLVDTEQRSLVRVLRDAGRADEAARLEEVMERVRLAVEPVFAAIHRSSPIEVHQADPEAVETDIDALVAAVADYLRLESEALETAREAMPALDRRELDSQLASRRADAVPLARPPRTGLGRALARLRARVDAPDAGHAYQPVTDRRRAQRPGGAGPSR